ncbi:MAG: ribonuclease HII [Sulfolobales archaeon]
MTSSRRTVIGIDEAGRGSLVGDMFVAGVALSDEQSKVLLDAGIRDSKALSRSTRYRLLLDIIRCSDLIVISRVLPEDIDKENINDLEVRAIERILKHARSRGVDPTKVVVDEIAGRRVEVETAVRDLFPSAEVIMRPKADKDFVQVSAASIVAKCLRDGLIKVLSSVHGEIGSGYPSDPRTIKWLKHVKESGSTPCCIRKSWKTLRRVQFRTLDMYAKSSEKGG